MNSLLFILAQPYSLSPSILTHLPLLSPFAGDIGTLILPEGMQELTLCVCTGITGDIGTLVLPAGMQILDLGGCTGLTGDIGTLVLPEGMQYLDLMHCTGLTGKAKGEVKE
jgi:hypothetical protein